MTPCDAGVLAGHLAGHWWSLGNAWSGSEGRRPEGTSENAPHARMGQALVERGAPSILGAVHAVVCVVVS